MVMGRKRQSNHNLPPRMHKKGNAYYYVTTGKPRKWLPLGNDYSEAKKKWAEYDCENDETGAPGTFSFLVKRYLEDVAPTKAEKTFKEYTRQGKRLNDIFGKMRLSSIRPMHVAQYLDNHPHKVAANREIALMSTMYSFAMRWGLCDYNPCRGVKKHGEKPRNRYITNDEFIAVRDIAPEVIKSMMDIAYLTGMRESDLLNIKISDIKDDGLYVTQGKTGKRQIFEMTEGLSLAIANARKIDRNVSSIYLLPNLSGRKYTTSGFQSIWHRLIKRSGVNDFHFHDIRAKSATDAKRDGLDYQQLLGHSSREMSDRYVKSKTVEVVVPLKNRIE